MIALIIIAYLTGCVVGYILIRKYWKVEFVEWTVWDRNMALILSILSWVSVLIALMFLLEDSYDSDKPAKW